MFFLRHEYRTEEPAVDIRMFRENIGYGFSNLSALLNYGATFAISYLVSIYLQVVQGFSSQATGLIMIAQPAIMAGRKAVRSIFSVQAFLYRNGSLCTRDVPLRFPEPRHVPLDRHHSTDHNWVWFRSVLIA